MYFAFTIIIFLFSMVLQTSVFPLVSVGGIKPDVVLVLVIYLGLVKGSDAGCVSGFCFGLFEDVYSGMFLGTNALTKTLVGFLAGLGGRRLYTQSLVSHLVCVGLGTVLDMLLVLGINGFISNWKMLLLYETLYNMICCVGVVIVFRFAEQRLVVKSSL